MPKLPLLALALLALSCHHAERAPVQAPVTKPVEHTAPTADQRARRTQSEAYCRAHGVPIYGNPNALFVAAEADATTRTKEEVVDRALALCYLGLKSEGLAPAQLAEVEEAYRIAAKLTAKERAYAAAPQPTEQQKLDANWRYESLHTLLWALGFVEELRYPDQLCPVAADVKIIHDLTEAQFRARARLRSKKELLDQADLILRLHWACVNARVENEPVPGKLDAGVVFERHYSLNWLTRYLNQDWDDVTTDT